MIDIISSPEKVFYWLGNPERAVQWMTSVTKTETIKETPGIVGTTFRETIEENGRTVEMTGVVTGYIENKMMSFFLSGKYNTVEVEFRIEELEGFTRLTQTANIHFKSVFRILSLITGSMLRKKIMSQSQKEFLKLKELCEQDAHKGKDDV